MLSAKAVKQLRKLEKYILAEPRRFNMRAWVEGHATSVFRRQKPPCGIVGCLGGNAIVMEGHDLTYDDSRRVLIDGRMTSVEPMARRILGLDLDQADRLFYVHSMQPAAKYAWPEKFDKAYRKAGSMKARARVAVARIEHFIATGGDE